MMKRIVFFLLLVLLLVSCDLSHPSSVKYVIYNSNGGKGDMPVQSFKIGVSQRLASNVFVREGWVFKGWNTAEDGLGTPYEDMAECIFGTTDTDLTLYAQWYPFGSYYVKFVDSFDNNAKTQVVDYDKPDSLKTLAELGFNHGSDYQFTEWNTTKNGTGFVYNDGSDIFNEVNPGETLTLYTQWEGKITYKNNGGTGSDYIQPFRLFNSVTLLSDGDQYFNKQISGTTLHFAVHGWTGKEAGTGAGDITELYNEGETVKEGFSSNKTLYVKWGYEYDDGYFSVYEDLDHYYVPDYYSVWGHSEAGVSFQNRTALDYVIVATGPVYVYENNERKECITVKIGDGHYCYVAAYSDVKYRKYQMQDYQHLVNFAKDPGTDVLLILSVRDNSGFDPKYLPSKEYMSLWGKPLVHSKNDKVDYILFKTLFDFKDVTVWSGTQKEGNIYYAVSPSSSPFWVERDMDNDQGYYILTALY